MMLTPLYLLPGVIFDTRSVVISVGGLFGGPLVAAITFAMASAFRLWQGGPGALMGVLVSFCSAALGAAYYFWKRRNPKAMSAPHLYGFGVAVHLVMLVCALALPGDMTWRVLNDIALPVMIVYPLASLLLCLLIADRQARIAGERLLKESEERFRQAFMTSPDAVGISRLSDGVYVDVNDGFLALTGHGREEVIGHSALELGLWQDPGDRQRLLAGLEGQGKVSNLEAKFLAKDGSVREGLLSAVLLTLEGQRCILSIVRDIGEIKKAQAELRQWADAFRHCAHGLAIGLPATNSVLVCNPAFARMLGYPVEQMAGRPILSVYAPQEHEHVRRRMAEVAIQEHVQYETRMLRADKTTFPAQMDLVSVRGPDGEVLYRVATMQDITQRKQAEETLRANERRLGAILEASADPVVVYDAQGLATFVNPAFTRLFGWRPEEVIGQRIPFVPEDQRPQVEATIAQLYATGGTASLETKRLTKEGQLLNIVISAAGIPGQSGRISGMVVNLTDVTQTKRLEAQLRQAQKMEAIGTLAGGIAHDFNNILGVIMGYAEMAQEQAQQGRGNASELAHVLQAADRARKLVRQILTFSRKGEADLRPLDLNKSVSHTLQLLGPSLPKMIGIETHLAPDLEPVNADSTQMEQVLVNLATNAADAMPEGGRLVMETSNVTLGEEYNLQHLEVPPGRYVLLAVSDSGQGMSPEILEHIFDPFFTTKEVGKGTGLGLSTVYGIVKGHGGHVSCYSEPGLGSTFKVYLPVYRDQAAGAAPEDDLEGGLPGGSETILLVDDEEALRELGRHALEMMGYRVITAHSGEKALEIYLAPPSPIDLVVMDLGMPGMGGHNCLKEILRVNPRAKVIIASGYSANGQVKASLESGAAGYVAKPFRRSDLLTTLRDVLDRP
ncbi:MAG: PAS domain S-box protein [Desulfarculus sp.]|nr:PAS domain S-box protein [Desulfarculus sp.]